MTTIIIAAAAAVWIVCGILAYGHNLASFQREFPTIAKKYYRSDQNLALVVACFGPIGLIISLCVDPQFHGFMFCRPWVPTMDYFLILIPEKASK